MTGDAADHPLLTPLTAEEWGDDEYAAFGALMGIPGEDVPRAGSGEAGDPLNFDIIGVLARHPKMARKFLGYNAYLLQLGELPLRLRELAVLRLAHTRRSSFFWGEHVKVAKAGGLSDDDIARPCAATPSSTEWTGWSSRRPTSYSPTAEPRGDMGTPRRRTRYPPGHGADFRRRYLRDVGDGLRHLGGSYPRRAARSCQTRPDRVSPPSETPGDRAPAN